MPALRPLLAGCLAILLGACQTLSPQAGGDGGRGRLQEIIASGELRIGLSGNQPPLNMRNKRGDIIGLEVDIVDALARSMGLEPRLSPMPFADLLGALERGDVDLVISGMTITPERNSRVAFAGPYLVSGKSILTKLKAIASAETPAVLDDPRRTYAVLAGSTSEMFVKLVLPKAAVRPTSDYDQAVKLVLDDQVDAMVADYPICLLSVLRHRDAGLHTLSTPFTVEPLGIALPADAPLLVNLVENYLDTLEHTGLLTQFKARWLSDGAWVDDLP